MRLFLMAATAAGFAFATMMMMADEAAAVQDMPTTVNGVEMVCTGVGSAKDDPRWAAYPVKIVLSTPGGANLANAHITLAKGSQEVAALDCDAPWILFKPPAGSYTATATLIGGTRTAHANFATSGSGGQKEVTLVFPRAEAPAQ